MTSNGWAWKIGGPVIGAAIVGLSIFLWGAVSTKVKADITADSATKADLKRVEDTNATEHSIIKDDLSDLKKRQKADGKVTRAIARKLRIELPAEPKDEP